MSAPEGTAEFFEQMTSTRYREQPWHPELLQDWNPSGALLEIGSGAGTDHALLASMALTTVAVDLAHRGASLTQKRLRLEGRRGSALVADGENLPFSEDSFDAVYSFGVIHHTDHPERVADEIGRVLTAGGSLLVALYHRRSLFAAWWFVKYLATWLATRETWPEFLARLEGGAADLSDRPTVRLYSRGDAERLFGQFDSVTSEIMHIGSNWPILRRTILGERLARRWGWYVIIRARGVCGRA